jgi:tRNA(fMet)-specific endonuclease VapC
MAVNVALDTNAYSDFARGDVSRVQVVQTALRIHMPLFVLAELRAGFRAGRRSSGNESRLQQFLSMPRVTVLLPDEATSHQYADLVVLLRRQGTPLPVNDIWIAALSLQHNLVLCTSDQHFQHIAHLPKC